MRRPAGISRDDLVRVLHAENVLARRYFYPGCHQMEPYRSYFPHAGLLLPETERLTQRVMSLPTGTAVGPEEIEAICAIIRLAVENSRELRSQAGSASGEAAVMNAASPGPADVKVSVAMITYNHERFIAQAIESVLMQQTDFAVELVIGEDCSTDGTRAIVRELWGALPGANPPAPARTQPGSACQFCRNLEGVPRASTLPSAKATTTGPIRSSCRSRWISWISTQTASFAVMMS